MRSRCLAQQGPKLTSVTISPTNPPRMPTYTKKGDVQSQPKVNSKLKLTWFFDRLEIFLWPLSNFLLCTLTMGMKFTPNSLVLHLGGSYISKLSLQICLASFKNFLWWVGCRWCPNVDLGIGFGPSLDLGTWTYGQGDQFLQIHVWKVLSCDV